VDGAGVPYFALYDALSIINWKENSIGGRKDLKLLVLEEQFENSEDEFGHDTKTVHRVLSMVDGALTVRLFDGSVEEDKTPDLGGNQLS
ncbi:TPA: hypothetical protein ACN96P_003914, partial [Acinetobacter baumannii]